MKAEEIRAELDFLNARQTAIRDQIEAISEEESRMTMLLRPRPYSDPILHRVKFSLIDASNTIIERQTALHRLLAEVEV